MSSLTNPQAVPWEKKKHTRPSYPAPYATKPPHGGQQGGEKTCPESDPTYSRSNSEENHPFLCSKGHGLLAFISEPSHLTAAPKNQCPMRRHSPTPVALAASLNPLPAQRGYLRLQSAISQAIPPSMGRALRLPSLDHRPGRGVSAFHGTYLLEEKPWTKSPTPHKKHRKPTKTAHTHTHTHQNPHTHAKKKGRTLDCG